MTVLRSAALGFAALAGAAYAGDLSIGFLETADTAFTRTVEEVRA